MDYISSKTSLLTYALSELEEEGFSTEHPLLEPKTLASLCLLCEIPWSYTDAIIEGFRSLSKEDFSKMSDLEVLEVFKEKLLEIKPDMMEPSELTTFSFIRILGKKRVPELYELSCRLFPAMQRLISEINSDE